MARPAAEPLPRASVFPTAKPAYHGVVGVGCDKTEAEAAKRAALKEEVRKELLGEQRPDMPYPIADGSPLDALALAADKRPTGDPVTATRMYEQLVASGANR